MWEKKVYKAKVFYQHLLFTCIPFLGKQETKFTEGLIHISIYKEAKTLTTNAGGHRRKGDGRHRMARFYGFPYQHCSLGHTDSAIRRAKSATMPNTTSLIFIFSTHIFLFIFVPCFLKSCACKQTQVEMRFYLLGLFSRFDLSDWPVIGGCQFCQRAARSSLHDQEPERCKNTRNGSEYETRRNEGKGEKVAYLLDVLHHHTFNLGDLSLDFSNLVDFFGVVDAVLHLFLQFRPEIIETKMSFEFFFGRNMKRKIELYPNSLFRLLGPAVEAFPPPYFFVKSSLIRSRKAIGSCLPADSTATTQYATWLEKNQVKLRCRFS